AAAAQWPSVGVVITTRARPNLVRRALASVVNQAYLGPMPGGIVGDHTRHPTGAFRRAATARFWSWRAGAAQDLPVPATLACSPSATASGSRSATTTTCGRRTSSRLRSGAGPPDLVEPFG